MLLTAKSQGYFNPEFPGYDKIQIVTVEDLMDGKGPQLPVSTIGTFKSARKSGNKEHQEKLF